MERRMKNHTKETDKKWLAEKVDNLTEENQRYFLGVLEALSFSQSTQKQADTEIIEEKD
jgi:hypothetical protein